VRTIKFRIYNTKKKVMYPPASIWKMNLWGSFFPEDYQLMEYTGLKDKNGKEIYEGDIIKCGCDFTDEYDWIGIVKFDLGSFYVADRKGKGRAIYYWSTETFGDINVREVIGNIYENPELVKT
jgi:uncharacterized phage protein (TIGR01671 family)